VRESCGKGPREVSAALCGPGDRLLFDVNRA
jgi:hypothetical protein